MDTVTFERIPSQPAGVVLGETYRLARRIGIGGMGEVYEAMHVRLPGRFAVKILLPDLLANSEAFARFCREAEIMSELRHPAIVQIFDFNTTPDGRPYFVMELLEGRDLEVRLTESGPLPLPAVVRILEAVASALGAAHGHGVVHRDLKPANIFLAAVDGQADEIVKVLDFGISQVRAPERRLSQAHHVLGTPPYMAPEQVRGTTESIDGRADQFALGAIAYRMLTGRDAFIGPDTPALLYQIVHENPPPLLSFVPASWDTRPLQAVLDRALAKEPERRWGGMMELARAFEEAAERTIPAEDSAAATAAPPRSQPAPSLPPKLEPDRPAAPTITDEPPPIRLRPLRKAPPPPRSVERLRFAPAGMADSTVRWDLPSSVDRIPTTNVRAATLGVIALLLAGTLLATGWYRDVPAALPFARENLRAWVSPPPPLEQPAAEQTNSIGVDDTPAQTSVAAAKPGGANGSALTTGTESVAAPPEPAPLPATGALAPVEPGPARPR